MIANFEEYNQEQLDAVGLVLPGNRKYKVNAFTNYSFSEGPLKGFSIGGGYRHLSKVPIGRYPDGSLQNGDSYWESHGSLGYRFGRTPVPWVKRLRLQLNVINLTDEDDPYVMRRLQTTPTETIRRIRVREPRTWRMTASSDF